MLSVRLPVLAILTLISGTALAGNLTVSLTPSAAVSAGAQWRVDAGAWRNSATTVKNLSNATHTVEFKAISGWIAPANATVTLTNNVTTTVTGAYVQPSSVAVTLNPAGGQWQIDGGSWRNSATTASGLMPGAHTISYNALTNYTAPATETVNLIAAQTTTLSRTYTAAHGRPAAQRSAGLHPELILLPTAARQECFPCRTNRSRYPQLRLLRSRAPTSRKRGLL
jgi:hypothetical protein